MNSISTGIGKLLKKTNPKLSIKVHSLFFSNSISTLENFDASLKQCDDVHSLKKLHACIYTYGFDGNIFLGSKLINLYANFGFLIESRWIFRRIINNNLSLWNSVVVGYFRAGHFDEVLKVYSDLRRRKIGVHSSAITFSLKSCIELGSLDFGKGVHVDVFKFGLESDPFVGSSMIGMYSKHGHIEDASKVFDEITDRDLVAYTSMITGYAHVGDHCAYKAFSVARRMQKEGLDPNRITLVSLLQVATHLRALEHGQTIHGYAIRRGIGCLDEVFETSLMDMYSKCGILNKAAIIFGKMSSRTVGSWNALIAGHLQLGDPFEAVTLFFLMLKENQKPDLITLANGILGCANLELLRQGKSIHGYIIRNHVQLDVVATTALIDMYMKCYHVKTARQIFAIIEEKDVILFNVMMAGYIQNGLAFEAVEAFCKMVGTGLKPNLCSILSVLSALGDLKNTQGGKCAHGYVLRHGFESNIEIANQVIYMYSKSGFIDRARQVFNRVKYKDLVSFTSMMMGYVNHGHADEAVTLFRLMQREKLNPDSVTLICLLRAFALLGCLDLAKEIHAHVLRVHMEKEISVINSLLTSYSKCGKLKIARDLFQRMDERCLASWNTMIAAYGMHGNCLEALKLFNQLKNKNIMPDESTFMAILSGCSHSGLVEEGLSVFRSMKEEYSLTPIEEHYGCMVDLLSRAGQLEEAYDLLKCLPLKQSGSGLGALLAACRVHGNTKMGEVIGRRLLDKEPQNPSAYGLVSNMYAEDEKWNEVAEIRAMAKEKGLKRTTGYSLIELEKQVQKNPFKVIFTVN